MIRTIKKNGLCSLFEVKEKNSDILKFVKIYNKSEINLSKLDLFVELIKKETDLKLNNVLLYDKYIINEKHLILVMKKCKSNLEELVSVKELKENEIN